MAISLSHVERRISRHARVLNGSAIHEILKLTERPRMISSATGTPSLPDFPLAALRDATICTMYAPSADTCQYSAMEGVAPLRGWIARERSYAHHAVPPSGLLITSGSQQALDQIGKVLVDPQAAVLVEANGRRFLKIQLEEAWLTGDPS